MELFPIIKSYGIHGVFSLNLNFTKDPNWYSKKTRYFCTGFAKQNYFQKIYHLHNKLNESTQYDQKYLNQKLKNPAKDFEILPTRTFHRTFVFLLNLIKISVLENFMQILDLFGMARVLNLSLNRHGPTVSTGHLEKTLRKKNISHKTFR